MGEKLSRKWITMNVRDIRVGVRRQSLDPYDISVLRGGYDSTLTYLDKQNVEMNKFRGKFHINIPMIGWVECVGY